MHDRKVTDSTEFFSYIHAPLYHHTCTAGYDWYCCYCLCCCCSQTVRLKPRRSSKMGFRDCPQLETKDKFKRKTANFERRLNNWYKLLTVNVREAVNLLQHDPHVPGISPRQVHTQVLARLTEIHEGCLLQGKTCH